MFDHLFSIFFFSVYRGGELWSYMIILHLTFWGHTKLLSTAATPFCILPEMPTPRVLISPSPHQHLLASTFVCYSHPSRCEKWKSLSRVRLCATLWTVVCQLPLSIEFSRPEYWSGWLVPSPGDLPNSVIKPRSPTLKVDSLPAETPVDENSLFVFKSFKKLLCYICA